MVQQQISIQKLTGSYAVLISHSHPTYKRYSIKSENSEELTEDTSVMKNFPLRAKKTFSN